MRHSLAPEPVGERVPNLAPMVDIIMVILIFFMLGASFKLIVEGYLQTDLDPRSGPGGGAAVEINPVVKVALESVNNGENVNVYVMAEKMTGDGFAALREHLATKLRQGADPTSPVVIAAHPSVKWKHVVRAMDAAVAAKFENVQFAVSLGGDPNDPAKDAPPAKK